MNKRPCNAEKIKLINRCWFCRAVYKGSKKDCEICLFGLFGAWGGLG